MPDPYVGELRLFAGNFAPVGWAPCDGRLLQISENETLFQLIGTTYGGDGQETFALPDLRSRVPVHQGLSYILGENGGVEQVTLTVQQIPAHTHPLLGSANTATQPSPGGQVPARFSQANIHPYVEDTPTVNLAAEAVGPIGGSQPHENMQPYLGLTFIISLFGVFPSPT